MNKRLFTLLVGFCCVSECLAQSQWVVPKLQELTGADAIKLGAAHFSSDDEALVKAATREDIDECVKGPAPGDPSTADEFFGQLRARRVALTPSGISGIIVQGTGGCMCGAVGNCPFWIIGEKPSAKLLLEGDGGQTFELQCTHASGYFDVVLGNHNSAMVTNLGTY